MFGASRCIAVTLCKFGGPETLPQATPYLCIQTCDSGFLARVCSRFCAVALFALSMFRSARKTILAKSELGSLCLRDVVEGQRAHVQGREATALFAAGA